MPLDRALCVSGISLTNSWKWFIPTTMNMSTTTFAINTTQMVVLAALATDCPISFNDTDLAWTVPELED